MPAFLARQFRRGGARLRPVFAVAIAVWLAGFVRADYEIPLAAYNPPASYYTAATGTGNTLRTQLRDIVSAGFVARSYGDSRYALEIIERDPANASNILLVYNRASVSGDWDLGATWNREHVWPKSLLNLTSAQVQNSYVGAGSDLFELRPSNPQLNSDRSNFSYGTTGSSGSYGLSGSYWYPGDADRGDVARSIFYMATRYYGTTDAAGTTYTLNLKNGTATTYNFGDQASLLKWHYEDGIDNFERRRNQAIYSSSLNPSYYQGNRNPFIDRPEYVWAIFGGGVNNSKLYVGASAPADGASTASVSLGRVMRNGALGTSAVTLNKAGAHPTTYDIALSGAATSAAAGAGQTIGYDPRSRVLTVGLSSSTSTTGLKSGQVVINNTDLTTGGAGLGSADGNDTINVSASVLDKRVVSAGSPLNFGRVIVGGAVSGGIFLATSGDDDNRTRVDVAGAALADANGISVSSTPAAAPGGLTHFASASTTSLRTLSGSFATAGAKAGSLSLAVTTAENGGAGIAGEGAYAPVALGYTASALDHSDGSFSLASDVSALTLDFGIVALDSASPSLAFALANRQATAGFTAGLDVDAVSGTGDTAKLTTSVSPASAQPAGTAASHTASLNTADEGSFEAVYSLMLSDENLAGATAPGSEMLSLTLRGTVMLSQWLVDADGLFGTASNWVGGVPSGVAGAANFLGQISAARTVTVDSGRVLNSLSFNSAFSYALVGTGALTMSAGAGGGTPWIGVYAGAHRVESPLELAADLEVYVGGGASLSLLDVRDEGGFTFTKTGEGLLVLPNLDGFADADIVVDGGTLVIGEETAAMPAGPASGFLPTLAANRAGDFDVSIPEPGGAIGLLGFLALWGHCLSRRGRRINVRRAEM